MKTPEGLTTSKGTQIKIIFVNTHPLWVRKGIYLDELFRERRNVGFAIPGPGN